MRDIENAGFIVDATATREQIIYSIKALPDAADAAISTLSEAVFSPPIRDYIVSSLVVWTLMIFDFSSRSMSASPQLPFALREL